MSTALAPSKYQVQKVFGATVPMNTWGHITTILAMLYKMDALPELSVYATDKDDDMNYYINGEPVGTNTDEVLASIWKMVECWRTHGYLFEN